LIKRVLKWIVLGVAFVLIAGASAYMTVSFVIKTQDRVIVPALVGKDVARSLEILSGLGLHIKVTDSDHSDAVPANHVLSQEPAAGAELKQGRDVRVMLSKGPKMVSTPNLAGLSLRRARILLEQRHLCTGKLSKIHRHDTLHETVLAQFPEKETPVPRGRCVDLLVALGPRPRTVKMPELTGELFSEAVLAVQRMNLTLGPIAEAHAPDEPAGVILAQDPPAGHPIGEGDAVALTRNRKSDTEKRDYAKTSATGALFTYRVKDGFLKTRIRLIFNGYGLSGELIDAYMDPGEEILLLIPGNVEAAVRLYEGDTLVVSRTYKP
jgi:serine/threonine-protein kinase